MSDVAAAPQAIDAPERSLWTDVWFQFRHHRGAMVGVVVFAVIVFLVVFGPSIWRIDPSRIDVKARNAWPSIVHPMGTDNIGRDLFAQVLQGGRVSLAVGVTAMLIALFLGTFVGVLAGYFRRLDGPLGGIAPLRIALADRPAPLNAAASEIDAETLRPVIAPAGRPFPLVDFGKSEIKELF